MKGFVKFCFIAAVGIFLWSCFATPDVDIVYTSYDGSYVDGFWLGLLVPFILALCVVAGVFVFFGVFAAVLISVFIAGISLVFVGISMFWPILLALILFYWLFSESKEKAR